MTHRITLRHTGGSIKNVEVIGAQGNSLFIHFADLAGIHTLNTKTNRLGATQWGAQNPEEAKRILRSLTGRSWGTK